MLILELHGFTSVFDVLVLLVIAGYIWLLDGPLVLLVALIVQVLFVLLQEFTA